MPPVGGACTGVGGGVRGAATGLTLVASGTRFGARGWICVLIRRENRVALACRLEVHNSNIAPDLLNVGFCQIGKY